MSKKVFHVAFLQCRKPSQCLWSAWNAVNLPQQVWVSTVTHTAFGIPGESVLSKDELRTSHVCVVNRHQQGALNLGGTCQHPIFVWCSIWTRQESAEDLARAISDHSASVDHHLQATCTFAVNSTAQGDDTLSTCTCAVTHEVCVDHHLVSRIVQKQQVHPFHWQNVQALDTTITFVETNV
jgi:hypothetical protein